MDPSLSSVERRSFGSEFNASAVDLASFSDVVFGPNTFWELISFVLTLSVFRSTGTFIAGWIYYYLLDAVSEENKAKLERLDFFFNENTWATNTIVNLYSWFLVVVGHITINLLVDGPTRTVLGFKASSVDKVLRFLLPPSRSIVFLVRVILESFGMILGWLTFAIIGEFLYGKGSRKKRDVFHSNLFNRVEDIESFIEEGFSRTMQSLQPIYVRQQENEFTF